MHIDILFLNEEGLTVMTVTVKRVEKELNVPRHLLLREGMKRYLEFELRRLEIEADKIRRRHSVKSFDDL